MKFLKPLVAFLVVNLSIIIWIWIIVILLKVIFGIDILSYGNYINLLIYSFTVGFIWALISLFTSKWMVRYLYWIQIITPELYNELKGDITNPISQKIVYLYDRLQELTKKYNEWNIELWIYESSEPNAFATWCWLCGKLIAFSTWILETMDIEELDWVLWHEFAHIMNWDMVTTTILQWFLNTFVIFISRILAWFLTDFNSDDENEGNWSGIMYYLLSTFLEFIFGLIVSIILAWYSRIREYAADKDSGLKYSSLDNMISALKKLKFIVENINIQPDSNNDTVATLKIYNFAGKLLNLFSTHPPLEDRIKKLEKMRTNFVK